MNHQPREPHEAPATALRLALSVLDGAPAQRVSDRLLTEVLDGDGAEGVLAVATAAVVMIAEIAGALGHAAGRDALIAAIEGCRATGLEIRDDGPRRVVQLARRGKGRGHDA